MKEYTHHLLIIAILLLSSANLSFALSETERQSIKKETNKLSNQMEEECLNYGGEIAHCNCVGKRYGELSYEGMLRLLEDFNKALGEEYYTLKIKELGEDAALQARSYCQEQLYQKIQESDISEDYRDYFRKIEKAAKTGDAESQYQMGEIFSDGEIVEYDDNIAAYWYEKAAIQGHLDSQYSLGYWLGELKTIELWGKLRDAGPDEAKQLYRVFNYYKSLGSKWLHQAAEAGHADAQYKIALNIASCISSYKAIGNQSAPACTGYEPDVGKLFYWINKSIDQGNHKAMALLGRIYKRGRVVEQDNVKAIEWLKKAAYYDNKMAFYYLGEIYSDDKSIPYNKIEAFKWYMKAAKQGFRSAQDKLDQLCKESPWACK